VSDTPGEVGWGGRCANVWQFLRGRYIRISKTSFGSMGRYGGYR
jgi:hypothetical protein